MCTVSLLNTDVTDTNVIIALTIQCTLITERMKALTPTPLKHRWPSVHWSPKRSKHWHWRHWNTDDPMHTDHRKGESTDTYATETPMTQCTLITESSKHRHRRHWNTDNQCTLKHRCSSGIGVGALSISVTSVHWVVGVTVTSVSVTPVFSKLTSHIPRLNQRNYVTMWFIFDPIVRGPGWIFRRKIKLFKNVWNSYGSAELLKLILNIMLFLTKVLVCIVRIH